MTFCSSYRSPLALETDSQFYSPPWPPLCTPPACGKADPKSSWAGPAPGYLDHVPTSAQGCQLIARQHLSAGCPLEGGKHSMHAACSRRADILKRLDRLPSLLLPGPPTQAHKTRYVHKVSHAGAEGPDHHPGKCSEGHVPEGESRRRQGPAGGRKAANRVACRPDNNKDGNRGFQRRSGCTQH